MDPDFIDTIKLTGKLSCVTTTILLILGLPIAYFLAYSTSKIKVFFEALLCMPMVLPPTVIGYYLLVSFSPQNFFGGFLEKYFSINLAFSFEGIVIASVIAGLPFMIQPLQHGFMALPKGYKETSYILGKSKFITFYKVLLPNIKNSIMTGLALTFSHCIGEFGIVLMVGGNIPKETRIAAIAIYDEVQALNNTVANQYSVFLFVCSFILLILIYGINKKVSINI